MIATVKIAPLEKWCDFHAKHFTSPRKLAICQSLVGMEIQIFPNTMRTSVSEKCLGRLWDITEESNEKITAKGCRPENLGICEHLLEMD